MEPTQTYNSTGGVQFWNNNETVQVNLVYANNLLTESLLDLTTLATYTTQYAVNLSSVLGSNNAYVGFTAATGGNESNQYISNFSFSNSPSPVDEPTSLGLLAIGLFGLSAIRKSKIS